MIFSIAPLFRLPVANARFDPVACGTIVLVAMTLVSCNSPPKDGANARTRQPGGGQGQPTAVDVAVAAAVPLTSSREYTGTTQPLREVAIRAQAEGQVRQLKVDVGDRVNQGQVLAQLDDAILNAETAEAEAELASRRTEIVQLQAQVSDAQTQVAQSQLQLQQAQSDAARYSSLAKSGAVSRQQAEQFRTQAQTATQVLRSAQAKVSAQQQAIVVAKSRITAQQAVVNQQKQRRGYAVVTAPISGSVLTRSTDRGNLVRVGDELMRLGDFSQTKAIVQISDIDLANVKLGATTKITLDAFPTEQFVGRVTRISPAANPTSRLVPVEMTIPNPTGKIGSGLLARVTFAPSEVARVVVPLSALQDDRANTNRSPGNRSSASPRASLNLAPTPSPSASPADRTTGKLFVLTRDGDRSKVTARSVTLGQKVDGKVQILSGLNPGERYVSRASKPLKDGEPVRLSILSTK